MNSSKLSKNDVNNILSSEEFGDMYELIGDFPVDRYIKVKEKLDYRHKRCGNTINTHLGNLKMKIKENIKTGHLFCKLCPDNNVNRIISTDTMKEDVLRYSNNKIEMLSEYTGWHNISTFRHLDCGHIFECMEKSLRENPTCKVCDKKNNQDIYKSNFKELIESTNGEYILLSDYKTNKIKVSLKHNTCGHIWDTKPNHFQQGKRCPKCSSMKKSSKYVKEIAKLLDKNKIKFIEEFVDKRCTLIRDLRFDFMIELPNFKKKLLIEYDGEQHFNARGMITEEYVKKQQNRDTVKNIFVEEHTEEFLLIRIRYDKVDSKKIIELVNYINHLQKSSTTIPLREYISSEMEMERTLIQDFGWVMI